MNLFSFFSKEIQVEVSYNEILKAVCKEELLLNEEIQPKVIIDSPWSIRKASHNSEPCMALVSDGNVDDKVHFGEFINDMLIKKHYVLKVCCVHLDDKLSDNPILLFEPEQSLKDFCTSSEVISEIDQMTILRDVAIGTLGFQVSHPSLRHKVTVESIFVHKDSKGQIRALYFPLYQYSYFLHSEQSPEGLADYEWVKNSLLLMHYRGQCDEHSELSESHILYNIFKYKWFSDNRSLHPNDTAEIAKDIAYILGKLV